MLRDLQRLLEVIAAGHSVHDKAGDKASLVMEQVHRCHRPIHFTSNPNLLLHVHACIKALKPSLLTHTCGWQRLLFEKNQKKTRN